MHQVIPQSQIRARLGKLGLSGNEFARRAGLHHTTMFRIMNGDVSPELSTMLKITDALIAAERDVLAHLQKLHPEPGIGLGDAE